MERRDLLKTLGIGAAGAAVPGQAQDKPDAKAGAIADGNPLPAAKPPFVPHPTAAQATGSPTDPDLRRKIIPWDLVLTEKEMKTVSALADLIIPADDHSPAASEVGVPAFINEWVSAPYARQQADLETIRGGLAWINTEAQRRHEKPFTELATSQQTGICDDICNGKKAETEPRLGPAVPFFARLRDLVAGGFYTTPEGFKDLGYMGNVPNLGWNGPPPDVKKHLGIEDVPDLEDDKR